jgi:hypothetical protein
VGSASEVRAFCVPLRLFIRPWLLNRSQGSNPCARMGNQPKVARDARERYLHFPKKNRRGGQTAPTSALTATR